MVYMESSPLARYVPPMVSQKMATKLSRLNIQVYNYAQISYVMGGRRSAQVTLRKTFDKWAQANFHTDVVVFAPTRTPACCDLVVAEDSGIEVDETNGGIVVNSELQAISDVWAAGNSISFPCRTLHRRREQSACHNLETGTIAGANIAGGQVRYRTLPVFHSTALGLPTQLVGDINSGYESYMYSLSIRRGDRVRDETGHHSVVPPSVIFYLKDDCVVGSITIGASPEALDIARRWVTVGQPEGVADQIREQVRNQGKRSAPLEALLAMDAPDMLAGGPPDKAPKLLRYWNPSMSSEAADRRQPEKEADASPDAGGGAAKTRRDYYSDAIQAGVTSLGNKHRDPTRAGPTKKERYDHMAIPRVPKSADGVNATNAGDSGLNNLR